MNKLIKKTNRFILRNERNECIEGWFDTAFSLLTTNERFTRFFAILVIFAASMANAKPVKSGTPTGKVYNFASENEVKNYIHEHDKVVLQVYRPTCPVCIAFKKKGIYPKLAKNMTDIGFAMVNIENFNNFENMNSQVQATPTFIFYKDGQEFHRYAGYVEYPQFVQKIRGIFGQPQKAKRN